MYQSRLSKFNNRKTEYNGRVYDSFGESQLAMEIDALVQQGRIVKVEPQVTFDLFGKNGGKICTHRPDFLLTFNDGHQEVWEYKGLATPSFRLKLKLFEDNHPEIPYWVITPNQRFRGSKKRKA